MTVNVLQSLSSIESAVKRRKTKSLSINEKLPLEFWFTISKSFSSSWKKSWLICVLLINPTIGMSGKFFLNNSASMSVSPFRNKYKNSNYQTDYGVIWFKMPLNLRETFFKNQDLKLTPPLKFWVYSNYYIFWICIKK